MGNLTAKRSKVCVYINEEDLKNTEGVRNEIKWRHSQ